MPSFQTPSERSVQNQYEVHHEPLPQVELPLLQGLNLEVKDKDSVSETTEEEFRLAVYIAEKFEITLRAALEIIKLATEHADEDFPKRNDILALIAVESRYNVRAKFKGCFGLMQINLKAHSKLLKRRNPLNPSVNIEVGSATLRVYYESLGKNSKAAILSFNAGIGSYLKRRYNKEYYSKYREELKNLSRL
jgi:hypothetical protein